MEIKLRAGCPDDADALTDLFITARRTSMPYLPERHKAVEIRQWIEHVVLKSHTVTVAEHSGQPAGFAAVRNNHLEHLYVAVGFQGMGIGSRLLQKLQTEARDTISLYVFQKNARARSFYEQHGFYCVALTDGSGNEEGEPDAIYLSEQYW